MLSRGGKARVLVYIASFGGLKGDLYLKIGNGSLLCGEISKEELRLQAEPVGQLSVNSPGICLPSASLLPCSVPVVVAC